MLNLDTEKLKFYKKIVIATLLGISSGLPLYVLIQTIPAWFKDYNLELSKISVFGLVGIPFTLKYLWAPLLDRISLPFLGLRRGWMFFSQLLIILSIACMGFFDPKENLTIIVVITLVMTTFSATQDIVIDAYRRELLNDNELGTGNAWFVNSYRFSSLIPGALALILADHISWHFVFPIISAFMLIGLLTSLYISEQHDYTIKKTSFLETVIEPFKEYFSRFSLSYGITLLVFLMLYKLGDSMATALSTPFYRDMGFSNTDIGSVAKLSALWSSITGAFVAGYIMNKISINKSLWVFGFFQMITILGFAWLANIDDPTKIDLFLVVSLEYLGVGMGTVAMISFMFKMSSEHFAATQIALFTAIASIPRTFISASTGYIIESVGYTQFFLICTAFAIPGMLLLLYIAPWKE